MDTEACNLLAAGRRSVDSVPVQVEGDQQLGRRVLEQLASRPDRRIEQDATVGSILER
jgi:hypothetical protein